MAKGGYQKEKHEQNKRIHKIRGMIFTQLMSKCILEDSKSILKIAFQGQDELSTTHLIQKCYLELQQVEENVQVNCIILPLY